MGRTVVVIGGTTGLGRAIALDRLGRGERVVVVGRNRGRLAELEVRGAEHAPAAQLHVLAADLALVGETRRVIEEIRALTGRVDALVLCARHFRSTRAVTDEGVESTFALLYLSRFVLSYEMLDLLGAAPRPVILNVAGPGSGVDAIRWDDLGGARDYSGGRALAQSGQLNDLLGVAFARRRAAPRVSYVLAHPGVVDTALSGEYDADDTAALRALRTRARPVEDAVGPLLRVLDDPPRVPLSAVVDGAPLDLDASWHPAAAHRLFAVTTTLLARHTSALPGVDRERLRRLTTPSTTTRPPPGGRAW